MKFTISALSMCAKHRFKKAFKIGDIIVIAVVVAAALILFGRFADKGGEIATVSRNGQTLYRIDLSDPENEGKVFRVQGTYTNEICVSDRKIYVRSSDCPNQSCVHSGKISQGTIYCVPNGMSITVGRKVDAVSR